MVLTPLQEAVPEQNGRHWEAEGPPGGEQPRDRPAQGLAASRHVLPGCPADQGCAEGRGSSYNGPYFAELSTSGTSLTLTFLIQFQSLSSRLLNQKEVGIFLSSRSLRMLSPLCYLLFFCIFLYFPLLFFHFLFFFCFPFFLLMNDGN